MLQNNSRRRIGPLRKASRNTWVQVRIAVYELDYSFQSSYLKANSYIVTLILKLNHLILELRSLLSHQLETQL